MRFEAVDRERPKLWIADAARRLFAPSEDLARDLAAACRAAELHPRTAWVLVELEAPCADQPRLTDLDVLSRLSSRAAARDAARAMRDALLALQRLGRKTVAVLRGEIDAHATSIALACSRRVVERGARLGSSAALRGLGPLPTSLRRTIEISGVAVTRRLFLDGERLGAAELVAHGLADAVFDDELPEQGVAALLTHATARSTDAKRRIATLLGSFAARRRAPVEAPEREHARALTDTLLRRIARARDVADLELDVVAELALSSPARRIAKYHAREHVDPSASAFRDVDAMEVALTLEALSLVREGVSADAVDLAARRFGFRRGPLAALALAGHDVFEARLVRLRDERGARFAQSDARTSRTRRHEREELEQRLALRFVNEAWTNRADAKADELDYAAMRIGGFPAFRGGPIAYVETIGAREIVSRLRHFSGAIHPRFTPADALLAVAGR